MDHRAEVNTVTVVWHVKKGTLFFCRNINGIGIDAPSIDYGPSLTYDSHQSFGNNNIFILENIVNAGQLPPTGDPQVGSHT